VEAPAVVACGASGAFRMSPRPGEDEGGEGGGEGGKEPGVRDGDMLVDGETAEDNVTAEAAAESWPRIAWRSPPPLRLLQGPKKINAPLCSLLTPSRRERRRFGPPILRQNEDRMRYRMGYRMRHDVETYDIASDRYRNPTTSHTMGACDIVGRDLRYLCYLRHRVPTIS
jgi:hypothetical protein